MKQAKVTIIVDIDEDLYDQRISAGWMPKDIENDLANSIHIRYGLVEDYNIDEVVWL